MEIEDIKELRRYHETRYQQEERLAQSAASQAAAKAHIKLSKLHQLMRVDLDFPL